MPAAFLAARPCAARGEAAGCGEAPGSGSSVGERSAPARGGDACSACASSACRGSGRRAPADGDAVSTAPPASRAAAASVCRVGSMDASWEPSSQLGVGGEGAAPQPAGRKLAAGGAVSSACSR